MPKKTTHLLWSYAAPRKLIPTLTSALLVFGTCTATADDTEVFFGRERTQPNVLFVIDTSGSMGWLDGGSVNRLERVKNGLRDLLATTNNINAGLLEFKSSYYSAPADCTNNGKSWNTYFGD